MSKQSRRVLSVAALLFVGIVFALLVVYQPTIDVRVEQKLTPWAGDQRALQLVMAGASLADIQAAFSESGRTVDHVSYARGSLLYWAVSQRRHPRPATSV